MQPPCCAACLSAWLILSPTKGQIEALATMLLHAIHICCRLITITLCTADRTPAYSVQAYILVHIAHMMKQLILKPV